MRADTDRTVFISYSSHDREAATRIRDRLEVLGLPCWMAPRDVPPGRDYGEAIIDALDGCRTLVLVLSEESNTSRHVATEVARAFAKGKTIVPVRLSDVRPSKALELFVASSQWINAWEGDLDAALARVAGAPPGEAPAEPPPPAPCRTPRTWWRPAAATLAVAALLAAAAYLLWRPAPEAAAGPRGAPGAATPEPRRPGAHASTALVIGINDYAQSGWPALQTARQDAEAVARVLADGYGFAVCALYDGQATRAAVVAALDRLTDLDPDDSAIVFFAGHGHYDERKSEGYWIPADARRADGARAPTEDWIWSSTVTAVLKASPARQILVIADSCYGGALFDRAATPAGDLQQYRRLMARPSRWLLASGGLEPVPDGTSGHSAFSRRLLDYLDAAGGDVFAASDVGRALQEALAGQSAPAVQSGSLLGPESGHGDFVFVRRRAADRLAAVPPPPPSAPPRPAADSRQAARDALLLARGGATNAAARLLAAEGTRDDRLLGAVTAYVDAERRARSSESLRELIKAVEARRAASSGPAAAGETARPRIIACLGPTAAGGGATAENDALLYRLCLRAELNRIPGLRIIEREALEQVLREIDLGSSALADTRAAVTVGRLLPAGLLLLGDLLPAANGERLYLRLVDTETTGVLASFTGERAAGEEIPVFVQRLAEDIARQARAARPLRSSVSRLDGNAAEAAIGRFHGADTGTVFVVVARESGTVPAGAGAAGTVGKAAIAKLGETSSTFSITWSASGPRPPAADLVIAESVTAP